MAASPKAAAEALVHLFQFRQLLNQDQNGRRITLLGNIDDQPALLSLERAAFPTDPAVIRSFLSGISNTTNLGANDIYRWYMAGHQPSDTGEAGPPDLKLNLIYPCTDAHVNKYRPQPVRMVTETPDIYARHVRPHMLRKREEGRLNWVFNIIEGRTEQEDVILREHAGTHENGDSNCDPDGFLLLPDLNWDRSTAGSLHLLALVERRDIWSLRDLRKRHLAWLQRMRQKILKAAVGLYGEKWGLEEDMLKLYVHYQPTYYHFHIHVVNVMLEAGSTQATGKAFGLENIISQLESMDGEDAGMADVSLTYYLGEASELWENVFAPLKKERARAEV